MVKKRKESKRTRAKKNEGAKPKCGLCGRSVKLTKTECCDQWICDDEAKYILFSFARNSCDGNHRRYTPCGHHHAEEHSGNWKYCAVCRSDFEPKTEIYIYYGTNEYNFLKLDNPPIFEPTKCTECGNIIVLSEGGYSSLGNEYWCEECTNAKLQDMRRRN